MSDVIAAFIFGAVSVALLAYAALRGIIARYVGANKVDFEQRKLLKEYAGLKKAQREAQDRFNAEQQEEAV